MTTTSQTAEPRPDNTGSARDPQQAVREAGTMGPGFGPGSARELMQPETFTGRPSLRGRQHMISAVHYLATMGGLQVLERLGRHMLGEGAGPEAVPVAGDDGEPGDALPLQQIGDLAMIDLVAGADAAIAGARPIGAERRGQPRIFISHGTADPILPIDHCSRVIVPRLQRLGYDVTFREFNGRHEVPPPIAAEGMRWAAAVDSTSGAQ